jgi:hypothetical protein
MVDLGAVRKRRQRLGLAGASAVVLTVAVAGGMGTMSQVATTAPVVVPNLVSFAAVHQSSAQRMPLGGPALSLDVARAEATTVQFDASVDTSVEGQQNEHSDSAP